MAAHPLLRLVDDEGRIICTKCERWQLPDEFHRNSVAWRGRASWCKTCTAAYHRTPELLEKHRGWRRRYKYGITVDEYEALRAQQDGICAVRGCGLEATELDHDHACCPGEVTCGGCLRGMLCRSCNVRLGKTGEDPVVLEARGCPGLADWVRLSPRVQLPLVG